MTVADLINSREETYSVSDGDTVHDAARYLRKKRVRSVGVIDASDRLVGVLSQSDISEKVAAENKCPAWIRAGEIMTTDLVTVGPETAIDTCLELLEQHGIHHLPVIDSAGRFHGMVSVTDLLQTLVREEKSRADLLESFINSH